VLSDPELARSFAKSGTYVVGGSLERFRDTWHSGEAFWTEAVARLGINCADLGPIARMERKA
jgi:hypothetical protein